MNDPDEFLPRAIIRPEPPRDFPKPEIDDIVGGIILFLVFVILFAVPWGSVS